MTSAPIPEAVDNWRNLAHSGEFGGIWGDKEKGCQPRGRLKLAAQEKGDDSSLQYQPRRCFMLG